MPSRKHRSKNKSASPVSPQNSVLQIEKPTLSTQSTETQPGLLRTAYTYLANLMPTLHIPYIYPNNVKVNVEEKDKQQTQVNQENPVQIGEIDTSSNALSSSPTPTKNATQRKKDKKLLKQRIADALQVDETKEVVASAVAPKTEEVKEAVVTAVAPKVETPKPATTVQNTVDPKLSTAPTANSQKTAIKPLKIGDSVNISPNATRATWTPAPKPDSKDVLDITEAVKKISKKSPVLPTQTSIPNDDLPTTKSDDESEKTHTNHSPTLDDPKKKAFYVQLEVMNTGFKSMHEQYTALKEITKPNDDRFIALQCFLQKVKHLLKNANENKTTIEPNTLFDALEKEATQTMKNRLLSVHSSKIKQVIVNMINGFLHLIQKIRYLFNKNSKAPSVDIAQKRPNTAIGRFFDKRTEWVQIIDEFRTNIPKTEQHPIVRNEAEGEEDQVTNNAVIP